MTDIVATDEFDVWYTGLNDDDAKAVTRIVELLKLRGVTLGFPYSSQIKGSDHALRELRVQSKGRPLRVLYAFDPKRRAVLLLGGDKTGDDRFYRRVVAAAAALFEAHVMRIREGG